MKIIKIFPDSLGELIGIHPGDRLLKINGKRVQDEIDYKFRITEENLILDLEKSLIDKTGINVEIKNNKNNSGKLSFEYKNLEQLDRLINIIRNNY